MLEVSLAVQRVEPGRDELLERNRALWRVDSDLGGGFCAGARLGSISFASSRTRTAPLPHRSDATVS